MEKKKITWVVDPHGHILKLAPGSKLKDGWRLATDGELSAASDLESARAQAESDKAAADLEAARTAQDAAAESAGGPAK